MSLTVDGFWKAGFWSPSFWANGFWYEGAPVVVAAREPGGYGPDDDRRVPLYSGDFLPDEPPRAALAAPRATETQPDLAPEPPARATLDALATLQRESAQAPRRMDAEIPMGDYLEAFAQAQQVSDEEAVLLLLVTIQ